MPTVQVCDGCGDNMVMRGIEHRRYCNTCVDKLWAQFAVMHKDVKRKERENEKILNKILAFYGQSPPEGLVKNMRDMVFNAVTQSNTSIS